MKLARLLLLAACAVCLAAGRSVAAEGGSPRTPTRPKTLLDVTPPAHPAVGPLNYGEILVRISAPGMRGVRDVQTGIWRLDVVPPMIVGTTRVFLVQAELVRVRTIVEARGGKQISRRIETPIEKLGFRTARLSEGKSHTLLWEPPVRESAPAPPRVAPVTTPKADSE